MKTLWWLLSKETSVAVALVLVDKRLLLIWYLLRIRSKVLLRVLLELLLELLLVLWSLLLVAELEAPVTPITVAPAVAASAASRLASVRFLGHGSGIVDCCLDLGVNGFLGNGVAFTLLWCRSESFGAKVVVLTNLLNLSGIEGQLRADNMDKFCECFAGILIADC